MGDFLSVKDLDTTSNAVLLFCPLSYGVHRAAEGVRASNEFFGCCIAAGEYFVAPVDRLIQLIAIPIFTTITHCKEIHDEYAKDHDAYKLKKAIVISIVTLPTNVFVKTVGIGVYILAKGLIELIPFKLYAAFTNADPTEDFFNARKWIRLHDVNVLLIERFEMLNTWLTSNDEYLANHERLEKGTGEMADCILEQQYRYLGEPVRRPKPSVPYQSLHDPFVPEPKIPADLHTIQVSPADKVKYCFMIIDGMMQVIFDESKKESKETLILFDDPTRGSVLDLQKEARLKKLTRQDMPAWLTNFSEFKKLNIEKTDEKTDVAIVFAYKLLYVARDELANTLPNWQQAREIKEPNGVK